mgnify:CR=1 FL=1
MTPDLAHLISEPLGAIHDRAAFTCGTEALDAYLHKLAGQEQRRNISRVFVMTGDEPNIIAGYYTLSNFSIDLTEIPDEQIRRLPRHPEIPAALIGRLAVATAYQGRGLGRDLLMDALVQIIDKSDSIGIYAVVVDAIDDRAAAFYEKYGFIRFPSRPDRLFLPIETAKKAFA